MEATTRLVKLGSRRLETARGVEVVQPIQRPSGVWEILVHCNGETRTERQFYGDIYKAREILDALCEGLTA